MTQQNKQGNNLEQIIKLAKQLHDIARISPDIKVCISTAVDQIIGNKQISQLCLQMGITKKDYVEFILRKIEEQK